MPDVARQRVQLKAGQQLQLWIALNYQIQALVSCSQLLAVHNSWPDLVEILLISQKRPKSRTLQYFSASSFAFLDQAPVMT